VLHRLPSPATDHEILKALTPIWKFGFIEDARTLAKRTQDGFEILQDFIDSGASDRYCNNLRRNGIEYIYAPLSADGFLPLGQVLPEITDQLADLLAEDADVIMACKHGIAARMDESSGEGYVFPDLSPDDYAEIVEIRQTKPN